MVIKINIRIVIIIVLKFIDLFTTFMALETGRVVEANPFLRDLIYNRPLMILLTCCTSIFLFLSDYIFRKEWKNHIKKFNLYLYLTIGVQIIILINNYIVFYRVI